jgi:hypothetical protein
VSSDDFYEITKKVVNEKLKFIMQNREKLVEAWIAATGIPPEDACLCHSMDDGVFKMWVERRAPEEITERIKSLLATP